MQPTDENILDDWEDAPSHTRLALGDAANDNDERHRPIIAPANDNPIGSWIERDEVGSPIRVVRGRATRANPLRCTSRPHGLGDRPSMWKATADHERMRMEEEADLLRYNHVIMRARTWTKKPVARNDNQSWPLLQVLRKDGNTDLVPVAERYRTVYDRASREPLVGTWHEDLYLVPKYAKKDDADNHTQGTRVTAHLAGNMAGGAVVRESTKLADHRRAEGLKNPPRRAVSKTKEWHGEENLAAVLDARAELAGYQSALGPLLESFEDAVVHSATLTEIGETMGAGSKTGGAVGKAIVMLGLAVVQESMRDLRRERRRVA